MRKVAITNRAVRHVEECAKWFETQQGPGFVPLIMWQLTSSSNPDFVPRPIIGLERRDIVDRSRVMECEGRDVEIFLTHPTSCLERKKIVDLQVDTLVLSTKRAATPEGLGRFITP